MPFGVFDGLPGLLRRSVSGRMFLERCDLLDAGEAAVTACCACHASKINNCMPTREQTMPVRLPCLPADPSDVASESPSPQGSGSLTFEEEGLAAKQVTVACLED